MGRTAIFLGVFLASGAVAQELPFSDVPRSHWAYDAVQLSARLGMFEGFEGYRAPRPRPPPAASMSPADRARAQIQLVSQQSIPATVLPASGVRPRLLDPMAEKFAQELERSLRLQQEAEKLRMPPPPPGRARSR